MPRYLIHDKFIHPDTGVVHMPGVEFDPEAPTAGSQEVELPDDGDPRHLPSVKFMPLDKPAMVVLRGLLKKKLEARQAHAAAIAKIIEEAPGTSRGEAQFLAAEEMIRKANGHHTDIAELDAKLAAWGEDDAAYKRAIAEAKMAKRPKQPGRPPAAAKPEAAARASDKSVIG